ncbi:MAG TPA: hypothetical protein VFG19_14900 [Geobacteraceae bacterium]|nr:hypothetical protein [Geobacteraceae bacterium]
MAEPAVSIETVNFRAEGSLNLIRCAGEVDPGTALSYLLDDKAMGSEPPAHIIDILGGWPKPLAEFLRREPAVEVGRCRIMQLHQVFLQFCLPHSIPAQGKDHPLHGQ